VYESFESVRQGSCNLTISAREGACDVDELEWDMPVHACEGRSFGVQNGELPMANREVVAKRDLEGENSVCLPMLVGFNVELGKS
jgi:hypothetical protein